MKFFKNVTTLEELKKEYRRLAMLHHPDRGGDEETMKAINAEHDRLFEQLKRQHNARADADTTGRTRHTTETAEEFRAVIIKLLRLDGLRVELCGNWLWVTGETRKHREALKAAGLKWSQNKAAWYWHHPEDGYKRWGRKAASMASIRMKYGSTVYTADAEPVTV